jgi:hypothetical protein
MYIKAASGEYPALLTLHLNLHLFQKANRIRPLKITTAKMQISTTFIAIIGLAANISYAATCFPQSGCKSCASFQELYCATNPLTLSVTKSQ